MTTLACFNITTFKLTCKPSGGVFTSRKPKSVSALVKWPPPPPPPQGRHQITHSVPPKKVEVLELLESWASENVIPLLKPVDECWQPSDFLPDSSKPIDEFMGEIRVLRDQAVGLPDDYFVVLVGDMVIQKVLPSYQAMISVLDGTGDDSVAIPTPWTTWVRAWTAEVTRHGDLLRRYLYLSGRVDMLMVERIVQNLVRAGMDTIWRHNPYLGFVYASLQEQATFVLHSNMARLAEIGNDSILASIYGTIVEEEKRHVKAHLIIVEKLLEVDPNGTMLAIGNLMRKKSILPAHLVHENHDPFVLKHFSYVAHRVGVYRTEDYVNVLEFLIGRWGLEKLDGLEGDGRCEQEFVCGLVPRIRKLQ